MVALLARKYLWIFIPDSRLELVGCVAPSEILLLQTILNIGIVCKFSKFNDLYGHNSKRISIPPSYDSGKAFNQIC